MIIKLLTEHNLEFLSLQGGCSGSSESTLVKMPHCWKSHVTALNIISQRFNFVNYEIKSTLKRVNMTRNVAISTVHWPTHGTVRKYSANHVYCRRPGPGHLLN